MESLKTYTSQITIRKVTSSKKEWVEQVERIEKFRNAYKHLTGDLKKSFKISGFHGSIKLK